LSAQTEMMQQFFNFNFPFKDLRVNEKINRMFENGNIFVICQLSEDFLYIMSIYNLSLFVAISTNDFECLRTKSNFYGKLQNKVVHFVNQSKTDKRQLFWVILQFTM
jgi:hypothetical protein